MMDLMCLNYVCDAGQPNNHVGGWYGTAYASYKCVESGEITRIADLGEISINKAEFRAIIHILWSLNRTRIDLDRLIVNIQTDSKNAIAWATGALRHMRPAKAKKGKKRQFAEADAEKKVFRDLSQKFAAVNLMWVPREYVIPILGH